MKLESLTEEEVEALAKRILNYRAKHCMSVVKFAKKVKVTTQTIYNIETRLSTPSRLTVAKIERVLDE